MAAIISKVTSFAFIVLVMITSVFAAEEVTQNLRSVNDIVAELNPLDVIANDGGVRRSIDLDIHFSFASAQLLPAADIQIEALAGALLSERLSGFNIRLIGHTDASGSEQANQQLSAMRANVVRQSLIDHYQVPANRLQAIGRGESSLIKGLAPGDSRHRRVEIVAVVAVQSSNETTAEPLSIEASPIEQSPTEQFPADNSNGDIHINW
jgi:outer membrane protein OmpA-like peptidoglycan-associated protein